jgi:hypothetical protein
MIGAFMFLCCALDPWIGIDAAMQTAPRCRPLSEIEDAAITEESSVRECSLMGVNEIPGWDVVTWIE